MTDNQPAGTDGLQFEKAEFSTPSPTNAVCVACKASITQEYFQTNGKVICPTCRQAFATQQTVGSPNSRFFNSLVMGIGAGVIGWAAYYAVYKLTQSQWGLISILVGYLVGTAVKKGSQNRGGAGYQVLAIVITYLSIVASYIPIFHEMDATISPVALVITAVAFPFLSAKENILGPLIIGFGLYQAWRINKKVVIEFTGPFTITPHTAPMN